MVGCAEHGEVGARDGGGAAEWRDHPLWRLRLVRHKHKLQPHRRLAWAVTSSEASMYSPPQLSSRRIVRTTCKGSALVACHGTLVACTTSRAVCLLYYLCVLAGLVRGPQTSRFEAPGALPDDPDDASMSSSTALAAGWMYCHSISVIR